MPHRLRKRQEKIQEKRKQTSWREFLMEIASWQPLMFYNVDGIISRYPKTNRIGSVISSVMFQEIRDNMPFLEDSEMEEYDFFNSWQNLCCKIPMDALIQHEINENSDYSETSAFMKNGYLCFVASDSENVFYSFSIKSNNKDIFNSACVWSDCMNVYSSLGIVNSTDVFYSKFINNSVSIWFSKNIKNCRECLFCDGLENKQFHIYNQEYSEQDYHKKKLEILLDKENFRIWYQSISIKNKTNSGKISLGIRNSEDVTNGLIVYAAKNARNLIFSGGRSIKSMVYDGVCSGAGSEFYATVHAAAKSQYIYCSSNIYCSHSIFYSFYMNNCSFCFGCIGLKNSSYCIFNKQYSKEEWYEKVNKIFVRMEKNGTLGNFFPASMNPFYFNDTIAYLLDDSFTKEEVTAKGYLRRDEKIKIDIPEDVEVIQTKDLDQYEGWLIDGKLYSDQEITDKSRKRTRTIDPEILKKVIQDTQGNYYRIIPMEYKFLKKHGLPLPRKHRLERLKQNFKLHQ